MDAAVFPSRRDAWLVILLWAASAALVVSALELGRGVGSPAGRAAGALGGLAAAGLALWILYGTDYRVSGDEVRIRSGPFRFRVPLAAIESVRPSRSPLSAPACSLDRVLIEAGRRRILISPDDREGFYRALQARRPDLRREGDALVAGAPAPESPARGDS